jgi:hypothetical protein
VLQKKLTEIFGIQFSEQVSRTKAVPLDAWPVAKEDRKDDLMMYL